MWQEQVVVVEGNYVPRTFWQGQLLLFRFDREKRDMFSYVLSDEITRCEAFLTPAVTIEGLIAKRLFLSESLK